MRSVPERHIVIFSHGFGKRKDDRGLLSYIAENLPNSKPVLFDYNDVDEASNTVTIHTLSHEARTLLAVVENTKRENPTATIDLVGHSQGALAVALAKPEGIRKIVLLAPPLESGIERMVEFFVRRPGSEINLSGISRLSRSDGSITIVPAWYWDEREMVDPVSLCNSLAKQNDVTIIMAKQDQVLGQQSFDELSGEITLFEIDGDHDFSGEAKKNLLENLRFIFSYE